MCCIQHGLPVCSAWLTGLWGGDRPCEEVGAEEKGVEDLPKLVLATCSKPQHDVEGVTAMLKGMAFMHQHTALHNTTEQHRVPAVTAALCV